MRKTCWHVSSSVAEVLLLDAFENAEKMTSGGFVDCFSLIQHTAVSVFSAKQGGEPMKNHTPHCVEYGV